MQGVPPERPKAVRCILAGVPGAVLLLSFLYLSNNTAPGIVCTTMPRNITNVLIKYQCTKRPYVQVQNGVYYNKKERKPRETNKQSETYLCTYSYYSPAPCCTCSRLNIDLLRSTCCPSLLHPPLACHAHLQSILLFSLAVERWWHIVNVFYSSLFNLSQYVTPLHPPPPPP